MDKVKNFATNQADLKSMLQGVHFPASKNDLLTQLQQRGVPSQVIDKLKNVDTSQFQSIDDVMSKL